MEIPTVKKRIVDLSHFMFIANKFCDKIIYVAPWGWGEGERLDLSTERYENGIRIVYGYVMLGDSSKKGQHEELWQVLKKRVNSQTAKLIRTVGDVIYEQKSRIAALKKKNARQD